MDGDESPFVLVLSLVVEFQLLCFLVFHPVLLCLFVVQIKALELREAVSQFGRAKQRDR